MPKEQHVGPETKAELTPFASPIERFQGNTKFIKAHQDLIDDPAFDVGADAALCQFVTQLCDSVVDLNSAASAGYQVRGAVKYLRQLKTLAETPKPQPKQPDQSVLRPTEPSRRA